MSITIDNGEGDPVEVKLDFGSSSDGELGGEGQQPGDEGGVVSGADQKIGPGGSGDERQEAAAPEVYRPDQDGTIHVERDGLAITAERPEGPDGPTTVTVEDGSGEPTTYTLGREAGEWNEEASGSAEGADAEGVTRPGAVSNKPENETDGAHDVTESGTERREYGDDDQADVEASRSATENGHDSGPGAAQGEDSGDETSDR